MKNVLKLVLVIMFVAVLPLLPAQAGNSYDRWKYEKQIKSTQDGLALMVLDSTVLDHSRKDLYDIRITDRKGQEAAYRIIRSQADSSKTVGARLIDLGLDKNMNRILTLDMQQNGLMHNEINLDVHSLKDYLLEVTIETSNDNLNWTYIGKGKILALTPKYYKSNLTYPTSTRRYLRLTIPRQGKYPVQVSGATVTYHPSEPVNSILLKTKQGQADFDDNEKTTSYVVDLGFKGMDIHHIVLNTDDQNYDRRVELYSSDNQRDWNYVTSGQIFHYKWTDYEALDNKLLVYAPTARYVKIVIHDLDGPSLNVKKIEVWGETPTLMVNLKKGDYVLRYGNPEAKEPMYDISNFSNKVDIDTLPVIKLGDETVNANYSATLAERLPWLLNAAIILAAAALGFVIVRNMKNAKPEPPADSE